ncbi:MAG: hybrid sensor histidine kinase/response regulator, partial [Myxococcales bacterium]|nr:hybrid sensor histidine kinase/response regulator [Myxococcales bacterium]
RSAQLAAIGSLAAGVAHEINNPLHFVMLSLESLEEGLEAPSREQRELLADIGQGLHRIRSISKTVLPFARFDAGEASAVDLNEAVRLAAKMAGNELRHRARVHLELGELPPLIGHPNMIGQLLTNLLSNAAQAIGEGSAALNEVRIETGCEGDTIYARISDTGPGIEPSMREDIFKRFYTSKPPGQGTGLGLALCADVAQAHGGTIHVAESRLGGATFEIRIPIRTGLEPTRQKVASGTIRKRSARVLLVDDDPLVLRGHARRLRRGFEAVCAESGAAALSILESDQAFDVILCDVMMPDMDGPEFYRQVELLYPDLCERFVFCTGGAFTSRAQVFLEQVGRPVIQKPIETPHLRAALYEAMGVGALSPPEVCEEG